MPQVFRDDSEVIGARGRRDDEIAQAGMAALALGFIFQSADDLRDNRIDRQEGIFQGCSGGGLRKRIRQIIVQNIEVFADLSDADVLVRTGIEIHAFLLFRA